MTVYRDPRAVDEDAIPVPHPVEEHITTVVNGRQEITEEQRARVAAWLKANGIDPDRVCAGKPIRIISRLQGDRVGRQVIEFCEFYTDPDGRRAINELKLNEALTFQRWVKQTVPLDPDPAWEGWDAWHARTDALKAENASRERHEGEAE